MCPVSHSNKASILGTYILGQLARCCAVVGKVRAMLESVEWRRVAIRCTVVAFCGRYTAHTRLWMSSKVRTQYQVREIEWTIFVTWGTSGHWTLHIAIKMFS